MSIRPSLIFFFFFNDTATTEIYTLSLHDALPISIRSDSCGAHITGKPVSGIRTNQHVVKQVAIVEVLRSVEVDAHGSLDRKSTRLNSSHGYISYAVFCLKKKKQQQTSSTYILRHT